MSSGIPHSTSIAIHAIRGASAQLVVIGHAFPLIFTAEAISANGPSWTLRFLGGWAHYAVMAFFVASGYLVGGRTLGLIAKERFRWSEYLRARLTRLWIVLLPALLLTLVCDHVAFMANGWDVVQGREAFFSSIRAELDDGTAHSFVTAMGNALFLQTIVTPRFGTNAALWSLTNEFWYYILFPAVLLAWFGRSRLGHGMLVVAILGLFLVAQSPFAKQLFIYLPIWLAGVLAYWAQDKLPKGWVAAGFIVSAIVFLQHRNLNDLPADFAVSAIVFFTIIGSRWVSLQWLQRPAEILSSYSYSLYAIHLPLLFVMISIIPALTQRLPYESQSVLWAMALLAITNAVAYAFYYFSERHTDALKRALTP